MYTAMSTAEAASKRQRVDYGEGRFAAVSNSELNLLLENKHSNHQCTLCRAPLYVKVKLVTYVLPVNFHEDGPTVWFHFVLLLTKMSARPFHFETEAMKHTAISTCSKKNSKLSGFMTEV